MTRRAHRAAVRAPNGFDFKVGKLPDGSGW
jgi:hypothetical protein